MKIKWMLLALALAGAMGVSAEEDYRVFTAKDGRTIEARIVEYDAGRGRLKIERRGAGRVWVTPDAFAAADQAYIKEWIAVSMFLAESNLKITVKKVNAGKKGSKKGDRKVTENIRYEINLRNRAKQPMRVRKIEYRCYIEKKKSGKGDDSERSVGGVLRVDTLKPGASKTLKTGTLGLVTLYQVHVESSTSYSGVTTTDRSIVKVSEERSRGIWLRVYGPKVDGQALYRDISYPKDLKEKVKWKAVPDRAE